MSNWQFDTNEVLVDDDGGWWHVLHRWQCVDCADRRYELADATHTAYEEFHADDVEGWDGYEGLYTSAGWETSHKPASINGFRVNGVLCGPIHVDHYRGTECKHDRECPNCGADGYGEIDIIVDYEAAEVACVHLSCLECGHDWEADE